MKYNVGDVVVYPVHGAGTIEAIEEQQVFGKVKKYYIMKMPCGDMKVLIPMDNIDNIGIRDVISCAEADNVINSFAEADLKINSNWNKRIRENLVKIKSGNIYEVAGVVKSLMVRDRQKGLSTGERKMLANAKQIFISELVLAKKTTNEKIERILSDIVDIEINEA